MNYIFGENFVQEEIPARFTPITEIGRYPDTLDIVFLGRFVNFTNGATFATAGGADNLAAMFDASFHLILDSCMGITMCDDAYFGLSISAYYQTVLKIDFFIDFEIFVGKQNVD